MELITNSSIQIENRYAFAIKAVGQQNVGELLEAALGDWIDFLFSF